MFDSESTTTLTFPVSLGFTRSIEYDVSSSIIISNLLYSFFLYKSVPVLSTGSYVYSVPFVEILVSESDEK